MQNLVLEKFPFEVGFYSMRDTRLPEQLPFTLRINPANGLIVQELNEETRAALRLYYELGGYGSTPLGESEYGERQGKEIIDAMRPALQATGRPLTQLRFLEVGASYGYLLHLLREAGATSVLGIEPGEEGFAGSKKYGIPMIQDFFPTPKLNGQFDVIFNYCVLEHIEDPQTFINALTERLEDGGVLFVAMPDCEQKMLLGDPSILSHQHVNYFTASTLKTILTRSGLSDVHVESPRQRSILYGWGVKRASLGSPSSTDHVPETETNVFSSFSKHFTQNMASLQLRIQQAEARGAHIGLYGASVTLKESLHFSEEPRLFDSDTGKYHKFMGPRSRAIESPTDLLKNPPDVLFICPIDYDQEITSDLKNHELDTHTELVSLKKIFEQNSGRSYSVGSNRRLDQ